MKVSGELINNNPIPLKI